MESWPPVLVVNLPSPGHFGSGDVDVPGQDWPGGFFKGGLADQKIDNAPGSRFPGWGIGGVEENLVQAGAAQVAIDEQGAMPLLGEGEGVIGAREALTFVRHGAREKEDLAFRFRPEERKTGAQVAEGFRDRAFRRFRDQAVGEARLRWSGAIGIARLSFPGRSRGRRKGPEDRGWVSAWSTVLRERSRVSAP